MPYLASGSYGCVFKPHLRCQDPKKEPSRRRVKRATVGKVFGKEEDFDTETRTFNLVKAIDPHDRFTLPFFGTCTTSPTMHPSDNAKECPVMAEGSTYNQIIMAYGGKSLDYFAFNMRLSPRVFKRLLPRLVPIMEGIVALKNHGQVHQDIKPDNIMFQKGRMYLIDFGIMERATEIFQRGNTMLGADYPYFPPEYKLFDGGRYQSADRFIARFLDNFTFSIKIAGTHANIPALIDELLGVDLTKDLQELHASPSFDPKKIDIYQLGITIFMLYAATKPKPVPKRATSINLRALIAGMIHPSPAKRLSPEEALRRLKDHLRHP